jgi:RimJ/RimL family protein N-acetyltransferase
MTTMTDPATSTGTRPAATAAGATPLTSRHVRLRPPTLRFIDTLYELASVGEIPWLWRGRRETPEGFRESVYADVLVQFAIEDRRSGDAVGLISAYDPNPHHGFAYVTLVLLPGYRFRVWPLEATILFSNYLFVRFNLRHLYGRSTEENFSQFRSGAGRYFEIEGCLRGHLIVNGEPQDLYLLTVTRERWRQVGLPLLDRIAR